jgi:hypothetical protein
MNKAIAVALTFLISASATTCQGPGPNLSSTGKDAVAEFHRFKMQEPGNRGFSAVMGQEHTQYEARSIVPFVC